MRLLSTFSSVDRNSHQVNLAEVVWWTFKRFCRVFNYTLQCFKCRIGYVKNPQSSRDRSYWLCKYGIREFKLFELVNRMTVIGGKVAEISLKSSDLFLPHTGKNGRNYSSTSSSQTKVKQSPSCSSQFPPKVLF